MGINRCYYLIGLLVAGIGFAEIHAEHIIHFKEIWLNSVVPSDKPLKVSYTAYYEGKGDPKYKATEVFNPPGSFTKSPMPSSFENTASFKPLYYLSSTVPAGKTILVVTTVKIPAIVSMDKTINQPETTILLMQTLTGTAWGSDISWAAKVPGGKFTWYRDKYKGHTVKFGFYWVTMEYDDDALKYSIQYIPG